jgi:cysteine desulfurase
VAALVNADPREIIWTSGATESNNLAIKGAAQFYKTKGKHIITVKTEHKAVLDTVRELERQGFEATYLEPQDNGLITIEQLTAAIRPDTILVSVMLVNNEIGVIQPIDQIGELCRSKGIIFHCDAAQATGKVVIDLQKTKVDLMTFTAHKTYGPKGIGALYVCRKPRVRIEAQMHGGGHERGCVRAPCRPTRSSAWAKPSAWPRWKWTARSPASRRATAWPKACRKSKKPTSTATWNTACRTT